MIRQWELIPVDEKEAQQEKVSRDNSTSCGHRMIEDSGVTAILEASVP